LIVFLFTLILCDALLRFTDAGIYYYNTNAGYNIRRFPWIPKCYRYVTNVNMRSGVIGDLSWVSGDHTRQKEVTFITDSKGFRNTEELPSYERILLSDSFGVSTLTDQPDILSEKMRAYGVPTYNISIDAANIWNEAVTFKYEIDNIPVKEGGIVEWVVFEGNDFEGRYFPEWPLDTVQNSWTKALGASLQNYLKNSVIRHIIKSATHSYKQKNSPQENKKQDVVTKMKMFEQPIFFDKSYVNTLALSEKDLTEHPNAKEITRCFKFLMAECQKRNLKLRCIVAPTKGRVYEWVIKGQEPWTSSLDTSPFANFFNNLCSENNIDFIDLTPTLISESKTTYQNSGDMLYWYNDTHWNDLAQDIVAKKLVNRP